MKTQNTKHYHQDKYDGNGVLLRECDICGKDFMDKVHKRLSIGEVIRKQVEALGEARKEIINKQKRELIEELTDAAENSFENNSPLVKSSFDYSVGYKDGVNNGIIDFARDLCQRYDNKIKREMQNE